MIRVSAILLISIVSCVELAVALPGACRGRPLPSHQTRKARDIRLECSSSVDHSLRTPQSFPKEEFIQWRAHLSGGDQNAAQLLRQKLPLIQWKGKIPYQTIEKWTWTDWVHGYHSSCPKKTKTWTDDKGQRHSEQVDEPCWHDEDRSEARHCSNEVMEFDAEFKRPVLAEWNPSTKGYYNELPNKYDLLPGEVEDVQIFNTGGGFLGGDSRELRPKSEIGDAWNVYTDRIEFIRNARGDTAACTTDTDYKIKVDIYTDHRNPNKRTPNAFRMPQDDGGRPINVLTWLEEPNGEGKFVNSKPSNMRLIDTAAGIIEAMAKNSRKFTAEREKAEWEKENKANQQNIADFGDNETGLEFFRETRIRVKLYEKVFGRDIRASHNLYRVSADLAEFFDPKEERYVIPLISDDKEHDQYRASASFLFWSNLDSWVDSARMDLKPDRTYYFEVSMYNKGVPFYEQDCETRSGWDCRFGLRGEDSYYSKPLSIEFDTDKHTDNRSAWLKALNWQQKFALRKFGW